MLKNEMIKNVRGKNVLAAVLILLAINIVSILIVEKGDENHWKENAVKMKQSYTEALNQCVETDVDERFCDTFTEQITLIEYSLEHNIPYGVMSALKYAVRMTEGFQILLIVLIFICGNVFAKEYESYTWKNLLMTGASKRKLFCSKWMFSYIFSIVILCLYFVISLLCGLLAFGMNHNMISLEFIKDTIIERNQYVQLFSIYAAFAVKLLFYSAVTVMSVVFMKGKLVSVLIPCILALSVNFIPSVIGVNKINAVLPFQYLAYSDIQNGTEVLKMIMVIGIYSFIGLLAAGIKFKKTDLV